MAFATELQARAAGEAMLAQMKFGEWYLSVWDNLGWHTALRGPYVTIHCHEDREHPYAAYVNDGHNKFSSGDSYTNAARVLPSYEDPNIAVTSRLEDIRSWLEEMEAAVEKAAKATSTRPARRLKEIPK